MRLAVEEAVKAKSPFVSLAISIEYDWSSAGHANIGFLSTTVSPVTQKYSLFWYEPHGCKAHDWTKLAALLPSNVRLIPTTLTDGNQVRECRSEHHDRFVPIGYGGKCLVWCTLMHHAIVTRYKFLADSASPTNQWDLLGDVVASAERCMDLWNNNTSSIMIQSYTTFIITTLKLNADSLLRSRPPRKMTKKTKDKRNRYLNELREDESCDSDDFYRMKKVVPRAASTEGISHGSSKNPNHKGPLKRHKEEGVLVIVALHLLPGDRRTASFALSDPSQKTILEASTQVCCDAGVVFFVLLRTSIISCVLCVCVFLVSCSTI